MADGPSAEIPQGHGEKVAKQVRILSLEERRAISESLGARGIFFGIYPVDGGRDTTRLDPFRDQIESVGLFAIAQVAEEMPIGNVSFGVFDAPERAIPEYGIFGQAHGHEGDEPISRIEIALDPESPHRETAMREELRKTIRHESPHDLLYEALGVDNITTLLDKVILEGLATHYEIEGSDDEPPLYAKALTTEQIPVLLARAREEFASEDIIRRDEWLHGSDAMNIPRSEEEKIPRWAGYALGYYLVDQYLKAHPGQKASTLYATPAEEFLRSYDAHPLALTGKYPPLLAIMTV